jgi:hypothetical protein
MEPPRVLGPPTGAAEDDKTLEDMMLDVRIQLSHLDKRLEAREAELKAERAKLDREWAAVRDEKAAMNVQAEELERSRRELEKEWAQWERQKKKDEMQGQRAAAAGARAKKPRIAAVTPPLLPDPTPPDQPPPSSSSSSSSSSTCPTPSVAAVPSGGAVVVSPGGHSAGSGRVKQSQVLGPPLCSLSEARERYMILLYELTCHLTRLSVEEAFGFMWLPPRWENATPSEQATFKAHFNSKEAYGRRSDEWFHYHLRFLHEEVCGRYSGPESGGGRGWTRLWSAWIGGD